MLARPAGFENFWLWSIGGSGSLLPMSALPPEADTNRKGRLVRWGSKSDLTDPKYDFRYSLESGPKSDIAPSPFRADSVL